MKEKVREAKTVCDVAVACYFWLLIIWQNVHNFLRSDWTILAARLDSLIMHLAYCRNHNPMAGFSNSAVQARGIIRSNSIEIEAAKSAPKLGVEKGVYKSPDPSSWTDAIYVTTPASAPQQLL